MDVLLAWAEAAQAQLRIRTGRKEVSVAGEGRPFTPMRAPESMPSLSRSPLPLAPISATHALLITLSSLRFHRRYAGFLHWTFLGPLFLATVYLTPKHPVVLHKNLATNSEPIHKNLATNSEPIAWSDDLLAKLKLPIV
jgi:hypothetical protein